ncbi:conserved hypothetical protein [Ricinus communis]|uniref:Reverse transcriptase zinc-binding domain-containing protein n=1 Tax=Ricinus communis TaxID=3988 RepID=B9T8C0_RICCO|nr:conserved hypothetical protein [Ricinus communis]
MAPWRGLFLLLKAFARGILYSFYYFFFVLRDFLTFILKRRIKYIRRVAFSFLKGFIRKSIGLWPISGWANSNLRNECTGRLGICFVKVKLLESWGWRSLCTDKQLLNEGIRCYIGTGKMVNALLDPWVPSLPRFKVDEINSSTSLDTGVADFVDHDLHSWEIALLHQHFPPHQVAEIIKIPLSENQDNSLPSSLARHGWKQLWKMKVPDKIKVFLWEMLANALPVGSLLQSRLGSDGTCVRCGALETGMYLFFLYALSQHELNDLNGDDSVLNYLAATLLELLESTKQLFSVKNG